MDLPQEIEEPLKAAFLEIDCGLQLQLPPKPPAAAVEFAVVAVHVAAWQD